MNAFLFIKLIPSVEQNLDISSGFLIPSLYGRYEYHSQIDLQIGFTELNIGCVIC